VRQLRFSHRRLVPALPLPDAAGAHNECREPSSLPQRAQLLPALAARFRLWGPSTGRSSFLCTRAQSRCAPTPRAAGKQAHGLGAGRAIAPRRRRPKRAAAAFAPSLFGPAFPHCRRRAPASPARMAAVGRRPAQRGPECMQPHGVGGSRRRRRRATGWGTWGLPALLFFTQSLLGPPRAPRRRPAANSLFRCSALLRCRRGARARPQGRLPAHFLPPPLLAE